VILIGTTHMTNEPEAAIHQVDEPVQPETRSWHRRRAPWVPACAAVIIPIVVTFLATRKRSALVNPSSSSNGSALPSDVVQVGLVNIFSRPEVYQPVVSSPLTPRKRRGRRLEDRSPTQSVETVR